MKSCNLTKSDLATILDCLEYALDQVKTSGGEVQVVYVHDQQRHIEPVLNTLREMFTVSVTKQEDITVLFTTELGY